MKNDDSAKEKYPGKIGRKLSLNGLRCFKAAAHSESFIQAARHLSLTQGAVSRAVRSLEDELGLALFERRHRAVFLTTAGRKLYQATQQAFNILESSVQELYQQTLDKPIVLSCESTLLMRWLIPRFPALQQALPDINLQLITADGPLLFSGGATVTIRRNDFDWGNGTHNSLLFLEKQGPVCKPEMLSHFVESTGVKNRLRHDATLLHTSAQPHAWRDWANAQSATLSEQTNQFFAHYYLSLQAAIAGVGLAILPWQYVRDDLMAKLLVAPFGFEQDGTGYFLLTQHEVIPHSRLAKVISWLQSSVDV